MLDDVMRKNNFISRCPDQVSQNEVIGVVVCRCRDSTNLFQRVAPRRVNRDAGEKFRKSFREREHHIVRHKHRTEIVSRRSIWIVHPFVREEDDGIRFRLDAEARAALSPAATNRRHTNWWTR